MEDKLTLICELGDRLEIMPNYSKGWDDLDWSESLGKEYPIFIDISEDCGDEACVAMTLEQATKLRDFLTEKIDFLSQK